MKINKSFISIALVSILTACNEVKESSDDTYPVQNKKNSSMKMSSNEIKGKRYALIIGNAKYTGDPNIRTLKNPVNDARDMKKTLEEVGFKVIYRENVANRADMETAVEQFTEQLKWEKAIGLFYYAGHGVQANGENYLIPTKVSIPTQVQLKHRAMPASYVLDNMEFAKNALNIIILDACRNNPLPARGMNGRSVTIKTGLAEMPSPSGSILIYSTAPGTEAYDGDGGNGIFTKHLLHGIKRYGYLPIESMLRRVRRIVKQETKNQPVPQVPWENTSLENEFCFSSSGCKDPQTEAAIKRAEKAERRAREAEKRAQKAERQARKIANRHAAAKQTTRDSQRRAEEVKRRVLQEAKRKAKPAAARQYPTSQSDNIIKYLDKMNKAFISRFTN